MNFEDAKSGVLVIVNGWEIIGRICEINYKHKKFTLASKDETKFTKKTKIYRAGTVAQTKQWFYPCFCTLADSPEAKKIDAAYEISRKY